MTDNQDTYISREDDTQKNKYLIFDVGNDSFGIEICYVTEIIGIQPVTEVPDLPEQFNGIINLRGRIIPVMNIRLRFGKVQKEYDSKTCIVILNTETPVGIIVDSVTEVLYIPESEIADSPVCRGSSIIKKVGKIGNNVKMLIDCNELIRNDNKEYLKNEMV